MLKKLKKFIKKVCRYPKAYEFKYSPSILHQRIEVLFNENKIIIESDGSTPLYETIAEIVEHDCYDLKKLDVSTFSKDSIALDIGANIGVFTLLFAPIFPGKIVCFEPVAKNCEWLLHNLKLNKIENVEVICKALSSKDGKATFYKSPESVGGSLSPFENSSLIEVETMSTKTLAQQFQNIEFVKLDCEGAEYDIIPDLLNYFPSIKYLTAEIHDRSRESNLGTISKILEDKNYHISTKPEQFERFALSCLSAERKAPR